MADTELNENERAIELSTVKAIFPELIVNPSVPFSAQLELPVSPATPLAVTFVPSVEVATQTGPPTPPSSHGANNDELKPVGLNQVVANTTHEISHLPPLTIRVTLPERYPADAAPIIHLDSQSSWLPVAVLQSLVADGRVLWEGFGRNQVVFSYIDHLQQAAEDGFGLNRSNPSFELPQDLEIPLLDFDLKAKRKKFEQETFECGVCLEPKKGAVCHKLLLCSHVFCVPCLQDFYNACITEGDVGSVKCLAPDCTKDKAAAAQGPADIRKRKRKVDRTLDPSELLQIPLEQETVQRYVKLKRKNLLESDRTTVYCPRQWCQGPARSKKHSKAGNIKTGEGTESDDEEEEPRTYDPNMNADKLPPPSERLAICEDCSFAFCKVCKASWHGEFAVCFPRKQFELTAEERASEDYLKKHSTACPTCDARVQKTMGCNHMICFKCNSHFCYLCSSWLEEANPYNHFNTPWMPCYMRLWELEEGDGVGIERQAPADGPNVEVQFEEHDLPVAIVEHPPVDAMLPVAEAQPRALQAQPPGRQPPPAPAVLNGIRINARVQQGLARPRPANPEPGGRPPVQGLQRFLQMVENDEEDEWDSDELDEDDEFDQDDRWFIPVR